ncbi:mucus-binding protein [Lactobacillus amylovorus]|uniref:mucus-binding protein n=1 Tax=Lactobacillus amylovorus TaxID=1604 RepID=UPI0021A58505|nr:mucus-binding protein [Lactobacillus amylovorus]MCT3601272.1 mucus-binding protein [Lactobacillus amylovorus]
MPLRVLKQLGYEAVFDNFDAPGVIQRFDNNDLLPQVFTIGLKKVTQNKQSLKIVDNQE